MSYTLRLSSAARRALAETLPEAVAAAVWHFVTGPLLENPHRVGTPLRAELAGRHVARRGQYRILYRIHDDRVVVELVRIAHRGHSYG